MSVNAPTSRRVTVLGEVTVDGEAVAGSAAQQHVATVAVAMSQHYFEITFLKALSGPVQAALRTWLGVSTRAKHKVVWDEHALADVDLTRFLRASQLVERAERGGPVTTREVRALLERVRPLAPLEQLTRELDIGDVRGGHINRCAAVAALAVAVGLRTDEALVRAALLRLGDVDPARADDLRAQTAAGHGPALDRWAALHLADRPVHLPAPPGPLIRGRDAVLAELRAKLSAAEAAGPQKRAARLVLSGEPRVGKTRIGGEVTSEAIELDWPVAAFLGSDAVDLMMRQLARELGIVTEGRHSAAIQAELRERLAQRAPWCIVLDGDADVLRAARAWLERAEGGVWIVSARQPPAAEADPEESVGLPIPPLDEAGRRALLADHLTDGELIALLAAETPGFPEILVRAAWLATQRAPHNAVGARLYGERAAAEILTKFVQDELDGMPSWARDAAAVLAQLARQPIPLALWIGIAALVGERSQLDAIAAAEPWLVSGGVLLPQAVALVLAGQTDAREARRLAIRALVDADAAGELGPFDLLAHADAVFAQLEADERRVGALPALAARVIEIASAERQLAIAQRSAAATAYLPRLAQVQFVELSVDMGAARVDDAELRELEQAARARDADPDVLRRTVHLYRRLDRPRAALELLRTSTAPGEHLVERIGALQDIGDGEALRDIERLVATGGVPPSVELASAFRAWGRLAAARETIRTVLDGLGYDPTTVEPPPSAPGRDATLMLALLAAGRIELDAGDPTAALTCASQAAGVGRRFLSPDDPLLRDAAVQEAEALLWWAELHPQARDKPRWLKKAANALQGAASIDDPIDDVPSAWRVAVAARVDGRRDGGPHDQALEALRAAVDAVAAARPHSAAEAVLRRHYLWLAGSPLAPVFDQLPKVPEEHPELGWRALAKGDVALRTARRMAPGDAERRSIALQAVRAFNESERRFMQAYGQNHPTTKAVGARQKDASHVVRGGR